MNSPSSVLVPLTFPSKSNSALLEASCSQAQPTVVKSWGVTSSSIGDLEEKDKGGGVILGAQDGTVYFFSQHLPLPGGYQHSNSHLRPTSPPQLSQGSRTPSRSPTPSLLSPPPFSITQKPRVVSGVTAEQVEAPKNYVDFDDEPGKLKNMLVGRQPRDSQEKIVSSSSKSLEREKSPTPSIAGSSSLRRKKGPKSLLSASNSPPFAASSTSHPSSPRDFALEGSNDIHLWCHIILPQCGSGHAVTRICLIEDDQVCVVLQETGDLSILSLQDGSCIATAVVSGDRLQPPNGIKEKDVTHTQWLWSHLEIYQLEESTIILTSASIHPEYPTSTSIDPSENDSRDMSRISFYEYHSNDHIAPLEARLEEVGQWSFEGPCYGVGLHQESDSILTFYAVSTDGHFLVRNLQFLPRVAAQMEAGTPEKDPANTSSIPLSNPFKALKARSVEHLPPTNKELGRVALDDERDLGELLPGSSLAGCNALSIGKNLRGIVWSENQLTAFEYEMGYLRVLVRDPLVGIRSIQWTAASTYTVVFEDRAECYSLLTTEPGDKEVDAAVPDCKKDFRSQFLKTIVLGQADALDISSTSQILSTSVSGDGVRNLTILATIDENVPPRMVWQASKPRSTDSTRVTSLLPLELDVVVQGYADGHLRQSSLMAMIHNSDTADTTEKVSEPTLDGYITYLQVVQNTRTKERFIVGGADDGSVAFWSVDHLKLRARWILFTTCLSRIIEIPATQSSPLKGCVLCIPEDGTIAVIAIDGFQFLYLIPGSATSLSRIYFAGNNLLLVYADNRARLWDIQVQEFRRSMTVEKAEELLNQGGWIDATLCSRGNLPKVPLEYIPKLWLPDVSSTLILDLDRFTTESITVAKAISTNRDQTRAILLTLERVRSVLSALLTPGLNHDIDSICSAKLGIQPAQVSVGIAGRSAITLYLRKNAHDPWCLSGDVTAARVLSIAVVLGALGLFEEFMEGANTVMIFYATSLATAVGPRYQPPNLVYLARRWFDGSNEVRRSARVLFDYTVACLSDEDSNETAERWQHHLPCLQPTADRESMHAALALFLCGYLACEKYSLLSASALTDISKSIALYLHDEQSLHRVLAIDLCSRGFHIWQHYIDAMEILRALFTLATTSRKESINLQNVGSQARLAVLQIASSNTALFMTTLGLDVLTPPTLEHRKSIMQIVAFLIRKRPLVLQPNIPKLMEAVVKSLDPNVTTHREAVLDSATEIIGYVVKTFPTADFHMATQRLAVGSSDGAVVMYDLKTAIRLYVLEGHKKAISACSFSPDGRRLLTLSLEESVVLVWKVGSSFTSFFNPGAPPRQGHGGSEPFKTINFNVGDDATMGIQGTMELIHFNWVADRSVKIKIRDSIMTFST